MFFNILYSWHFWVVLSVVIIIIAWVITKLNNSNNTSLTTPNIPVNIITDNYDDFTGDCSPRIQLNREDDINSNFMSQLESRRRVKNVKKRISPKDAIPDIDTVTSATETDMEVDFTPYIQVPDINVRNVNIDQQMLPDLTMKANNNIIPSIPLNIPANHAPYVPSLPHHIENPDYHPPSTRKPSPPRSKGEKECKIAAEKIYGVPFVSVWPDWLRNPSTGRCLELDLYNEELKLAIEFHGRQHYVYTPFYQKNGYSDFIKQVERDNVKLDICDRNNVYVITVPYNCPTNQIENYIRYYDPHAVMMRQNRTSAI